MKVDESTNEKAWGVTEYVFNLSNPDDKRTWSKALN